MIEARGWNTWNHTSYNSFSYLSEGRFDIEARISVFDPEKAMMYRDRRWKDLTDVGPHATDGSYTSHDFAVGNAVFKVESAHEGDTLFCTIEQGSDTGTRVVVEIMPAGGRAVRQEGRLQGEA